MMSKRTMISWVVAAAAVAVLGGGQAQAAGVSLAERADYNNSIAALMGGVANVKKANAQALSAIGDFWKQLVAIQQQKEQLRAARMANDMKRCQQFYALRKLYEDYRKAQGPRRPDPKKKAQQNKQRGVAARSASFRPTLSGPMSKLDWPPQLSRTYYVEERRAIERLMAQRTPENSGLGSKNCEQVQRAVAALRAKLQANIRTLSPMDYVAAKKFLDRVAYQARLPVAGPATNAVASR